jgi:hypothetical protein
VTLLHLDAKAGCLSQIGAIATRHVGPVLASEVHVGLDLAVTLGADQAVGLFSLSQRIELFHRPLDAVASLGADGRAVVAISNANLIACARPLADGSRLDVFDGSTGELLGVSRAPALTACAFSPCGFYLLCASSVGLELRDALLPTLAVLRGWPIGPVEDLCWDQSDRVLIASHGVLVLEARVAEFSEQVYALPRIQRAAAPFPF